MRSGAERSATLCRCSYLPNHAPPMTIVSSVAPSPGSDHRGNECPKRVRAALDFEPPGPGSWNLDPVHFPRPVTRYWAEMHPEPFRRGTHEFMAFYGTPIDSMEAQYVNGFAYNTMHPAPDEEIPQRFARAEEVWERKVWREQLREWDETFKPAAIAIHRELQSVDPDALSDDELVAYLTPLPRPPRADDLPAHALHRLRDDAGRRPARPPRAWTRSRRPTALAMLRGAAPVSAGASGELERLDRRDHERPGGTSRCSNPTATPARSSPTLRAFDGDVGAAMSAVPRPRRLSAARRLRHLRPLRARAARRAPALDPALRRRRRERHGRGRRAHRRHPVAGARGAPRGVRRAARRGAAHVPPPRRAGRLQRHLGVRHHAPRRARGRSPGSRPGSCTTPSTSSTRASTRCARSCSGTGGPSADELAQRSPTAAPAPPRMRRPRSGRRRPRRRTRPGCRPASAG